MKKGKFKNVYLFLIFDSVIAFLVIFIFPFFRYSENFVEDLQGTLFSLLYKSLVDGSVDYYDHFINVEDVLFVVVCVIALFFAGIFELLGWQNLNIQKAIRLGI